MSNINEDVRVILVHPSDKLEKVRKSLQDVEKLYRKFPENEIIPYAKGTKFVELAETVVRDASGPYAHPLYMFASRHEPSIGVETLAKTTRLFLESKKERYPMDILSISAGMDGDKISVIALVRVYKNKPSFRELYNFIKTVKPEPEAAGTGPRLVIPPGVYRKISDEEHRQHELDRKRQDEIKKQSDGRMPFLNRIDHYVPKKLTNIDERQELTYDLRTADMQVKTKAGYEEFIEVFNEAMNYITNNEKDNYYSALMDESQKDGFYTMVGTYIQSTFVDTKRLPQEDVPVLLRRIDKALFKFYVIQDLIDDANVTDIKITDPWTIRARIKGKAYLSNISFIDREDYERFIQGVAVMNGIDLRVPKQFFTNNIDKNYIMRFMLTSPAINSSGFPAIHIRKIPKIKKMSDELIRAGMMNEIIRDYFIDNGKYRSFVFAGPPGSGKTTLLNWFLEDCYESSAEILVIQEFDELFAYRRGVMFEHVVLNPPRGQSPVTLEKLGELALVSGANVFVIGETKGAEICHAVKLANSGCRTAMTMHSDSSSDTIDKMSMLIMQGMANIDKEQAKRMASCFNTIVYIDGYRVREILEITGFNEVKKDMDYRPVYIDPDWKRTGVFAEKKDEQ